MPEERPKSIPLEQAIAEAPGDVGEQLRGMTEHLAMADDASGPDEDAGDRWTKVRTGARSKPKRNKKKVRRNMAKASRRANRR